MGLHAGKMKLEHAPIASIFANLQTMPVPDSDDSVDHHLTYIQNLEREKKDLESARGYKPLGKTHGRVLELAGLIARAKRDCAKRFPDHPRRLPSLTANQEPSSVSSIVPLILLMLMLVLFMYRKPVQRYFSGKVSPMRRHFIQKKAP